MKIVRIVVLIFVLSKVVLVASGAGDFYPLVQFENFDRADLLWLVLPLTIAIVLFCTAIVLDNAKERGVIDSRWNRVLKVVILVIPLSGLLVMPLFHRLGR